MPKHHAYRQSRKLQRPKYGRSHAQTGAEAVLHCNVSGKARHRTRGQAKRHAKSLKRINGSEAVPYLCRHCGDWHVGRDSRPVLVKEG